ncbi:MAG TPA: alpha/beta hydrolase [Candidatus Cybelea sp.]|nr:alpha/beta hydrolase [Candidatus Cybelea sp.]
MLVLYIFAAYVLVLLVLRSFESRMVFFPDYPGRLEGDWHPLTLAPEDVWLTTSDGTELHSWWIANSSAKFTFLAFHGNASNIANRGPIYEFLRDTPANVLAVEYRGYGRSAGKPSEAGFYLDAEAGYQYLVSTRGLDPRSIISFGQSLGTAVATEVAARHMVGGLVLEAPFPSASQVARSIYWFLPGLGLLVRGQFDTQSEIQKVTAPVLVVHCTRDPVLPFQFGLQVYRSARAPKQLLEIDGLCHEESSLVAPVPYRAALQKFLASLEPSG